MIKILILDDEEGICEQLGGFFKYRGYKVLSATNGKDAIAIIKKENPEILLLDIKMAGIDGLEVLKKAKKENADVKAVMITALDGEETKSQAKELGADEYITKPFSYDVLEKLIIRLVNEILKQEGTLNK